MSDTDKGEPSLLQAHPTHAIGSRHGHHVHEERAHRHRHHAYMRQHRLHGETDDDAESKQEQKQKQKQKQHLPAHDGMNGELRRRLVEVVQTVSIVQMIDSSGSIVSTQTISSPTLQTISHADASLTAAADVETTATLAGATPPAATTGLLEPFTNGTETGLASASATVPAASLVTGLTASLNATATAHLQHNTTAVHHSLFANSTRSTSTSSLSSSTLSSSSFSSSSTLFSSTTSSASSSSTIDAFATASVGSGPNNGDGGVAATTTDSAPAATSNASDSGSGPSTGSVVGGVVGGVAGLAVLLVVAMFLLRWKRRTQVKGHRLLGDGGDGASSVTRALSGGGGGGGGGGGMAERRTTFLMPFAALAAAKGIKRSPAQITSGDGDGTGSATGGERGFYRVSGKKLPSVLQHGGNGYEDPHAGEGGTVYRDSLGFFGGAGGPSTTPSSRFAVGAPMRPESGVPVMHPSPAGKAAMMRVPRARQDSTFYDEEDDDDEDEIDLNHLSPPMALDPIGRTRASQDGSRGSRSRFTENLQ